MSEATNSAAHATLLPRIFISAVSSEFRTVRDKVAETVRHLGYEPVTMSNWSSGSGELLDWLRGQIDSCEGLIHIPGAAYGAEPPNQDPGADGIPGGPDRYSYTQFEFLYARAKGKKTWIIQPGEKCTRDTTPEELDLPTSSVAVDSGVYQSERQQLQSAYLKRLRASNFLHHEPQDDKDLEIILLKLRDHTEELRENFAAWQGFVTDHLEKSASRMRFIWLFGLIVVFVLVSIGFAVGMLKRDTGQINKGQVETVNQIEEIRELLQFVADRAIQDSQQENLPTEEVFNRLIRLEAGKRNLTMSDLRIQIQSFLDRISAESSVSFNDRLLAEFTQRNLSMGMNAAKRTWRVLDNQMLEFLKEMYRLDGISFANISVTVADMKSKIARVRPVLEKFVRYINDVHFSSEDDETIEKLFRNSNQLLLLINEFESYADGLNNLALRFENVSSDPNAGLARADLNQEKQQIVDRFGDCLNRIRVAFFDVGSDMGYPVPPYLGARFKSNENEAGVPVLGTVKGSPADDAGLLQGDRVLSLEGTKVDRFFDVISFLRKWEAGKELNLQLQRGANRMNVRVTPTAGAWKDLSER